jgi:nitrile hydratase subunit beta
MSAVLGMYGVEPRNAPHAAPRFVPGERVRVLPAFPPGHVRTPHYCRGKTGVIERICGAFANPEELAYARDGLPAQPLYRVRFAARELWPDYAENASDVVEIEIYQHWLESA